MHFISPVNTHLPSQVIERTPKARSQTGALMAKLLSKRMITEDMFLGGLGSLGGLPRLGLLLLRRERDGARDGARDGVRPPSRLAAAHGGNVEATPFHT